jgi:hypothetical protein
LLCQDFYFIYLIQQNIAAESGSEFLTSKNIPTQEAQGPGAQLTGSRQGRNNSLPEISSIFAAILLFHQLIHLLTQPG